MVLVEKDNIKVPAVITDCFKVFISLGNQTQEEYLVAVHWLQEHPHKNWFGNGLEVWQALTDGITTAYVFVSNVYCRCAYVVWARSHRLLTISLCMHVHPPLHCYSFHA